MTEPKDPPKPEPKPERPMVNTTPPMSDEERARVRHVEIQLPKRRTRKRW